MCMLMVTGSLNADTCTIYFKQVTVHRFLSPKNKIVSCNLTWTYIVTPKIQVGSNGANGQDIDLVLSLTKLHGTV